MPDYRGKRALDRAAVIVAALGFAPLLGLVGLAVWLEDGGPPLFLQPRLGAGRRVFTVLKFRTMRDGAVTRVGRWLRRTGLDELPQFLNVWYGEMSVVGPRPLTLADVERLGWTGSAHDWRFAARPGITGLSQLLAGGGARMSRRLDRLYLGRQSFSLDVRLIALSFMANLCGKHRVRWWLRARHISTSARAQEGVDKHRRNG